MSMFFRRLKRFLAPVVFTICGCATSPMNEDYIKETGITDHSAGANMATGIELPNVKISSGDVAMDTFCRQGKQRRAIKVQVVALTPKIPSGLPLDKANNIYAKFRGISKRDVTGFFDVASNPGLDRGEIHKNDVPSRLGEYSGYEKSTFDGISKFYVIGKLDRANIDKLRGELGPKLRARFYKLINDSKFYYGFLDTYSVTDSASSDAGYGGCHSDKLYVWPSSPPGWVYEIGSKPLAMPSNPSSGPNCAVSFLGTKEISPLKQVHFDSLHKLRASHTFLVPKEAQEDVFGDDVKGSAGTYHYIGYVYDWKKSEYVLSTEAAIKDSERAWALYFKKFTNIKESPSADAKTVRYEVALDLNVFCQYGRSKADLLSKEGESR